MPTKVLREAQRRVRDVYGEHSVAAIREYRDAHPGVDLADAVMALAAMPTYDELRDALDTLRAAAQAACDAWADVEDGLLPEPLEEAMNRLAPLAYGG